MDTDRIHPPYPMTHVTARTSPPPSIASWRNPRTEKLDKKSVRFSLVDDDGRPMVLFAKQPKWVPRSRLLREMLGQQQQQQSTTEMTSASSQITMQTDDFVVNDDPEFFAFSTQDRLLANPRLLKALRDGNIALLQQHPFTSSRYNRMLNVQDRHGTTLLHWMVQHGRMELLQWASQRFVDYPWSEGAKLFNVDLWTPVHEASHKGRADILELLLTWGFSASGKGRMNACY
jgi:hypothetical protein